MKTIPQDQTLRIKSELKSAGISQFKLLRFPSKYLTHAIHEDEHIMAALQGRSKDAPTLMGYTEAMLVATDRRILFIEHRPAYTAMDEINYDVVSGVNVSMIGLFGSLTLFTKIANYTLSFVNFTLAQRFADYIEARSVDRPPIPEVQLKQPLLLQGELFNFLSSHEIGVLSMLGNDGSVGGSVIYYTFHDDKIYFITKAGGRNASTLSANRSVALTVFDEARLQTAQIQGVVDAETIDIVKKDVVAKLARLRRYEKGVQLPPVFRTGRDFVVFHIIPSKFFFNDYAKL